MYLSGEKRYKIHQLIPGDDWKALFANENRDGWFWVPLVAWALVERISDNGNIGFQCIIGIIATSEVGGEMACAPDDPAFIGYAEPERFHVKFDQQDLLDRVKGVQEFEEEQRNEVEK